MFVSSLIDKSDFDFTTCVPFPNFSVPAYVCSLWGCYSRPLGLSCARFVWKQLVQATVPLSFVMYLLENLILIYCFLIYHPQEFPCSPWFGRNIIFGSAQANNSLSHSAVSNLFDQTGIYLLRVYVGLVPETR